jgi:rhomboid protease GluP
MEVLNEEYTQEENMMKREVIFLNRKIIFTYIILGINILLFIAMSVSGGSTNTNTLIRFGGKFAPLIWEGQWWRLITSIFLHIGIAHLAFNSYALYSIGRVAESLYGTWKFLFIYLLAGLWGSIASTIWGFEHISAGASGAIFGLAGSLLYFGLRTPGVLSGKFGTNLIVIIVFNIFYGFINVRTDNYAHLGGLLGGFIAAALLGLLWERISAKRFVGILVFLLISLGSAYFMVVPPEGSWQSFYIKGENAVDSEQYSHAIEYFMDADKLSPRNSLIRRSLGIARFNLAGELFNAGQYSEAIAQYKECQPLIPSEPAIEYNMGLAYIRLNQINEGLAAMRRALMIDPNFTPAKDILRLYNQ